MKKIKIYLDLFKWIFESSPILVLLDCIGMILSSVFYVISIKGLQIMFDKLNVFNTVNDNVKRLLVIVTFVMILQIFNHILNAVCNFMSTPVNLSVKGKLYERLHERVSKKSVDFFESSSGLDEIQKSTKGLENTLNIYHSITTLFTFYLPYFVVMGIYLFQLRPLLAGTILIIFVPMLLSQMFKEGLNEKCIDKSVPYERQLDYFEKELYHKEKFKENRLLGLFDFWLKKYTVAYDNCASLKWKTIVKIQLIDAGFKLITLLGVIWVLYILIDSVVKNIITVGEFAAIFTSINTIIEFMNDAINNYFGNMMENLGSIRKFHDFILEKDIETSTKLSDEVKTIQLMNVSYCYPQSERKVLENINLQIPKGEIVAIVGENGAGKSTLTKILLGLIKPSEGKVLFNGVDINEVDVESRYNLSSAVFQAFNKYKFDLRNNVAISNLNEVDENRIEQYLDKVNLKVASNFPDGMDTVLSKEFGGIDISGGQWQRVAIARALHKKHKILTMDEPTSAIDPIEESRMYRLFYEISKNKTSFIVTHRLGLAKYADRIIVLKNGKLIEQGTHNDLMEIKGEYYTMHKLQADWYTEEE